MPKNTGFLRFQAKLRGEAGIVASVSQDIIDEFNPEDVLMYNSSSMAYCLSALVIDAPIRYEDLVDAFEWAGVSQDFKAHCREVNRPDTELCDSPRIRAVLQKFLDYLRDGEVLFERNGNSVHLDDYQSYVDEDLWGDQDLDPPLEVEPPTLSASEFLAVSTTTPWTTLNIESTS